MERHSVGEYDAQAPERVCRDLREDPPLPDALPPADDPPARAEYGLNEGEDVDGGR